MLQLPISQVITDTVVSYPSTNPNLLKFLLDLMKTKKDFGSYSDYFGIPQPSQKARNEMSETLFGLWTYCHENEYPLFNYLVVLKSTGRPSTGIENWYYDKFRTLNKYDEYCMLQGELAKFVLANNIIVLV